MVKDTLLKPSNLANLVKLLIASLLYLLNFATGSDIISVSVTIFLAISLVSAKRTDLLPMVIYLSFFSKVMVYGHVYLSFFIVLAFFLRVSFDRSFNALAVLPFFAVYFVIHFISTGFGNLTIGRISEVLSFFLVLPAGYAYGKCNPKDCIIYYLSGFYVSTLFGFARSILPRLDKVAGDTDVTLLENMSEAYRFSGISNDSNFYAILVIVTLFILLFKIRAALHTEKVKNNFVVSILIIVTFVLGLMTYSKSYIISALVLFAVYYIRVKKLNPFYSIQIVLFGVIAYFALSSTISQIEGAYMIRFGTDRTDMETITSNRTVIWSDYFNDMSQFSLFEDLFGAGMIHEGRVAAHNTYIQLFYEFGFIGFLTNIVLIFKSKKVFVKNRLAKYSYLIISLIVVLFFGLSAYTFSSTWAVLTIMFVCCSENDIMV